jgi:hypothetical protein
MFELGGELAPRRGDTDDSAVGVAGGEAEAGKVLLVASARRSRSPTAKALERRRVFLALNDQVRPCAYMKEAVEDGTSATGAKSVLTPRSRKAAPVLRPCLRAISLEPSSPICGGENVGGIQGIVLTAPPSWSTAMRSRCCPPRAAARWSLLVIERSWAAEAKL